MKPEALAARMKIELQNIIDLESRVVSDRLALFCFDERPARLITSDGQDQHLLNSIQVRAETTVRTPADLPTLRASREVAVECYNSILDHTVTPDSRLNGVIVIIGKITAERSGTTIVYVTDISWVKVL